MSGPVSSIYSRIVDNPDAPATLGSALALSCVECQRYTNALTIEADGGSRRMKLKPLGDRLIVQAIEEEETTASGLVLPDTAKEKPQKGKVVAVGEGNWD